MRIDGVDFIENDIALENGFAILDDIGHGNMTIKAVADLLDGRRVTARVGTRGFCLARWLCGETVYRESHASQAKCESP